MQEGTFTSGEKPLTDDQIKQILQFLEDILRSGDVTSIQTRVGVVKMNCYTTGFVRGKPSDGREIRIEIKGGPVDGRAGCDCDGCRQLSIADRAA